MKLPRKRRRVLIGPGVNNAVRLGVVESIVSTLTDAVPARSHAAGRAGICFSPALTTIGAGDRVGDSSQPVTVVPVAAAYSVDLKLVDETWHEAELRCRRGGSKVLGAEQRMSCRGGQEHDPHRLQESYQPDPVEPMQVRSPARLREAHPLYECRQRQGGAVSTRSLHVP